MSPAVLEPAQLTAPESQFAPQFTPEGVGMKRRWITMPGHLAVLANELATSRNERKFIDDTMRRALKGETIEQQDEADGARKTQTLAEFMEATTELDEVKFNTALADLKDTVRQRPGAPKVVSPVAPNAMQIIAATLGAALDPKNAAQIGATPGNEQMRRQQVDQGNADRQNQAEVQQYEANVQASKLEADAAERQLRRTENVATAQYNEDRRRSEEERKREDDAKERRARLVEDLIKAKFTSPAQLQLAQMAAREQNFDLPQEFIDQATKDLDDNKAIAAAQKRIGQITTAMRLADPQNRKALRSEMVSLAQNFPDAFADPEQVIADYGDPVELSPLEQQRQAKADGQKFIDDLNQSKIGVNNSRAELNKATTDRINLLAPAQLQQFQARIEQMAAQTGLSRARAAMLDTELEYLPEILRSKIATAEARIEATKQVGEIRADAAKRADVKAGLDAVNADIKDLRAELNQNNTRLDKKQSKTALTDDDRDKLRLRNIWIEGRLRSQKKARDKYSAALTEQVVAPMTPAVPAGFNLPSGSIGGPLPAVSSGPTTPKPGPTALRTKRDRKTKTAIPPIISTKVTRGSG